ncbi:MAG: PD40 domain-containing protein [Bacteroidia bacterium]|nr:PD40 domain-containing protein [Bacteroidia bacterium]
MKKLLSLILIINLLGTFSLLSAQEIQWAGKVLAFSSQAGEKLNSAEQALGTPNVYPQDGSNDLAWKPKFTFSPREYLMLGFLQPMEIQQIMLVESVKGGEIEKLVLYDTQGKAYDLMGAYGEKNYSEYSRVLRIKFPRTEFKVAAIQIGWNLEETMLRPELDAVGIVDSQEDLLIKPDVLADMASFNLRREEMPYGVNSTSTEACPSLSPKAKKLYFSRTDWSSGKSTNWSNFNIWFCEDNGYSRFNMAEDLGPELNNADNNYVDQVLDEGLLVVENGGLKRGGSLKGPAIFSFQNYEWGNPTPILIENLPVAINNLDLNFSPDRKVLVLSTETGKSQGHNDLYVCFQKEDEAYTEPLNMGSVLNTAGVESAPWISPNQRFLIFTSNGHPGFGGYDLFISMRMDDSWTNWSVPQNLGSQINSKELECYFTAVVDHPYAYFCSAKDAQGSTDIFRIELPEGLRKKLGLISEN